MGVHLTRDELKTLSEFLPLDVIAARVKKPRSTVFDAIQKPLTPKKGRGRKKLYDTPERKRLAAFIAENVINCDLTSEKLHEFFKSTHNIIEDALEKEGYNR